MDEAMLVRITEEFIPFNKFLGVRARVVHAGRARLEIPYRPELIGDPSRPALHGGLMATLADTAGGMALWSLIDDHASVSTIDLRMDYLRPGKPEMLVAEAQVVRRGNRVGVVDIRLFQPSAEGETVATGKGVYNIKHPKRPPERHEG